MFKSHSQPFFWNPYAFCGGYQGEREHVGWSGLLYFFVFAPAFKQSQGGLDRGLLVGRPKGPSGFLLLITAPLPLSFLPLCRAFGGAEAIERVLRTPLSSTLSLWAMLQEGERALA